MTVPEGSSEGAGHQGASLPLLLGQDPPSGGQDVRAAPASLLETKLLMATSALPGGPAVLGSPGSPRASGPRVTLGGSTAAWAGEGGKDGPEHRLWPLPSSSQAHLFTNLFTQQVICVSDTCRLRLWTSETQ